MRLGQHMTEEQKAIDSAALMGNTNWLGHQHSEESKRKMSATMTGRKASPETRAQISKGHMGQLPWNKGIKMSEEVCLINRLAHLGLHHSEETKAKISAANINPPAERRAKMSAAGMGRIQSVETREKRSKANWKGGRILAQAKQNAKRRTLGCRPLNSWFVGCEGHHINPDDVIYMPQKLHRSIRHNQYTGKGMAEMNALAGAFLTEDWT